MGLDIVEFVMSVENAFDLRIPDKAAQSMTTPRRLIDYLHGRLPRSSLGYCLSQRIFYQLREALSEQLSIDRTAISPGTNLLDIIPEIVHALIAVELGMRRSQYTEDSRWVQDMGIS